MPSGPVCARTEVGARAIARSVARAAIPAPAMREFLIVGNMAGLCRHSGCGRPGRGLPIEGTANNSCRDKAWRVFHIFLACGSNEFKHHGGILVASGHFGIGLVLRRDHWESCCKLGGVGRLDRFGLGKLNISQALQNRAKM